MKFYTFLVLFFLAVPGFAEQIDYTLPDINGKKVSLSDYRGKWVIVNYWATWCPPCQEEIPDLVDFHERHKDKSAVVLGVNFEDVATEQLRDFVDSFMITYPILLTKPIAMTPLGAIEGLPTTFIVDPDGKLVARQVGPITAEQLEKYIAHKEKEAAAGGKAKEL